MERFVRQSLLYDFYGDLLTDHQKTVYEAYVLENLSLGEIAVNTGISRQGVHDVIRRCNEILENYEAKLGLIDKFQNIKEKVEQIQRADELKNAQVIAAQILEIL